MEKKKTFGKFKSLDDQDKLLRLIEEEDTFSLLSEENLGEGFNELMNNELISIVDGKIQVTELGKEARSLGIQEALAQNKVNMRAIPLPLISNSNSNKAHLYLFLILTFIIIVFLVILMMIQ